MIWLSDRYSTSQINDDEMGIYHEFVSEMHTECGRKTSKESTLEEKQISESNIKMGRSRCSVRMWNGLKWLKIGTSDGLL
jgi:hypothetical protein